jgi:transcriptional antiterminator NusG
MEKAVERNIVERITRSGMESKFGRILVPTEEVVEIKNGQKRTTERKFFPGYVLVEMVMDDETWHLVKHTNKVTGFVGGAKNRPAPISEADVAKIVNQMANTSASRKARSRTSMARSKRSTMSATRCVCL